MTTCTGQPAEQNVEAYVLGTLPEDERVKFEDHFFDCAVCLAEVEALQAVTQTLRSQPRRVVKAPIPWPVRIGILGAIAATLLLGYLGFRAGRETAQPSVAKGPASPATPIAPPKTPDTDTPVAVVADLTLPVFRAPNLRGQSGNPNFGAGMTAYSKQDCAGAVKDLAHVPAQDEDALAARFYSGVCLMHEGNMAGASKSLQGVAEAGDSPQQEAALYYLAQVALVNKDAKAARHYLGRTMALHGDFERRARAQLKNLRDGGE
jgi:hypothetical protein